MMAKHRHRTKNEQSDFYVSPDGAPNEKVNSPSWGRAAAARQAPQGFAGNDRRQFVVAHIASLRVIRRFGFTYVRACVLL
jgi:hypothetical protein